jgi:hypothetical protein
MGRTKKEFPPISEIGEKYKEVSFFKSQVIGRKKEFSWQQRKNIILKCDNYNKKYNTYFFINFSRIGEAGLWKIDSINGGSETTIIQTLKDQLVERVRRTKKMAKKMITGIQGNLFDPEPYTIQPWRPSLFDH